MRNKSPHIVYNLGFIFDFIRKKNIYIAVLFICTIYSSEAYFINKQAFEFKHAITYKPSKNRFGDQIYGYSRAKWLSYKYKLPFLFVPFKYSQELTMFHAEKHASKQLIKFVQGVMEKIPNNEPYSKGVIIDKESQLIKAINEAKAPTLFICEYKTFLDCSLATLKEKNIKNVVIKRYIQNYEKPGNFITNLTYLLSLQEPFDLLLKKMLKPIKSIPIKIPHDCVTIAVHVRVGSGCDSKKISKQYYKSEDFFDKNFTIDRSVYGKHLPIDVSHPTKVPPKQYFVDQIIRLSKILGDIPLFVHIFTDENETSKLVAEFKKRVNLPNIIWSCRIGGNSDDRNIVEDFYCMSQFDCLIRPESSFSLGASLLGSHKIIISPAHVRWVQKDVLLIDEIDIVFHDIKNCRRIANIQL